MCDLAATGADGAVTAALLVAAVIAIVVGAVLVRRSRTGVALLIVALVVAGATVAPSPAQAACPPTPGPTASAPAPDPATIGLIVTDTVAAVGARVVGVDVVNLSATATAFDVTIVGTPPADVVVDASSCVALAPGASCSILVDIGAGAGPFAWSYGVAGSNTNTVVDSITALAPTTLALAPGSALFPAPGDVAVITVTNTGTVEARFLVAALGGSDPGAFTVTGSTCVGVLPPSSSCTVTVTAGVPGGSGSAELRVSALNAGTVVATLAV